MESQRRIVFNNVDVTACQHRQCVDECEQGIYFRGIDFKCQNNSECYYKQLQRNLKASTAENRRLLRNIELKEETIRRLTSKLIHALSKEI